LRLQNSNTMTNNTAPRDTHHSSWTTEDTHGRAI
jgi:hypothetical protein